MRTTAVVTAGILVMTSLFAGSLTDDDWIDSTLSGDTLLAATSTESDNTTTPQSETTTRHAEYFGAGWHDDQLDGAPQGVSASWCDTNLDDASLAIGGALFCEIPRGTQIHMTVHDYLSPGVRATATCYWEGDYYAWTTFTAETTTTLPGWCQTPLGDAPDTTRVLIYVHASPFGGGIAGEIALSY